MENYNYNTELREIFTNTAGWVEKEKNQIVVINKAIEEYNSLYDALGDAKMETINSSSDGKYNFKQIKLNDIPLDIVLINEGVFLPMERYYKKQNFKQQARILLKKIQMMKQERGDFGSSASGSLSSPSVGVSSGVGSSVSRLGSGTAGDLSPSIKISGTAGTAILASKVAAEATSLARILPSVETLTGSVLDFNDITNIRAKLVALEKTTMTSEDKIILYNKVLDELRKSDGTLNRLRDEANSTGNYDEFNACNELIGDVLGGKAALEQIIKLGTNKDSVFRKTRILAGAPDIIEIAREKAKLAHQITIIQQNPKSQKLGSKENQSLIAAQGRLAQVMNYLNPSSLISAIGGGMDEEPYRSKYLKYKNKYLQLKRNLN